MAENEKPSKTQLEANVRVSDLWRKAVRRGTFSGSDAEAIGTLINFLDDQNRQAVAAYEAEMAVHPEWGRPKDLEPAGATA
jgi:hypothetical protein